MGLKSAVWLSLSRMTSRTCVAIGFAENEKFRNKNELKFSGNMAKI
jgi:hypothetical protein